MSASILIERIKQNRKMKIPAIGKFVFYARRPTDVEALEMRRSNVSYVDLSTKFVVDWENVTENDLVGGGGSDAVKFDSALWSEWCADNPQFWEPIASAVMDAYVQHVKDMEEAAKK